MQKNGKKQNKKQESHYSAQAGLKSLCLNDPPASTSEKGKPIVSTPGKF